MTQRQRKRARVARCQGELTRPARPGNRAPRKSLADYLAETPPGLHRIPGWEDMPAVGNEIVE